MATERIDGFDRDHFRAVTVTAIAALAGVGSAILSTVLTEGMAAEAAATAQEPQFVLGGAILVQFGLLRVLGLMKDDFGAKDALFIAFVTFSMWFVTFGIALRTGVSF